MIPTQMAYYVPYTYVTSTSQMSYIEKCLKDKEFSDIELKILQGDHLNEEETSRLQACANEKEKTTDTIAYWIAGLLLLAMVVSGVYCVFF